MSEQNISEFTEEEKEEQRLEYRTATFRMGVEVPVRPGLIYEILNGGVKVVMPVENRVDNIPRYSLVHLAQPYDMFEVNEIAKNNMEIKDSVGLVEQEFVVPKVISLDDKTEIRWNSLNHLVERGRVSQFICSLRYQLELQRELTTILSGDNNLHKIYDVLEFLCRSYPTLISNDIIPGRLTHNNIGATASMTRVTATRLIGDLKSLGLLSIDRNLILPNPPTKKSNDQKNS
jgi:hypothetical protein